MQPVLDMLTKLFSDIIGLLAGRGDDGSTATKVLTAIMGFFGAAGNASSAE